MIELILFLIMGIIFLIIGFIIWKKEVITLIHDYHYQNVSDNDIKPYTEKMGKAIIIIGFGMIFTGIIDFVTKSLWGLLLFGIFFIVGFTLIIRAQNKYNGGLF